MKKVWSENGKRKVLNAQIKRDALDGKKSKKAMDDVVKKVNKIKQESAIKSMRM